VLAAAARLRRREDFTATVRNGRRAGHGALVVHVSPATPDPTNPAREPSRAGFVVSRAVGGAVVRNLVQRRLRHLMRAELDRLPPGTDVVVRALPAAATRRYADLGADLSAALAAATRPRAPRPQAAGVPR
jgi:ribonuclease P protein component